MKKTVSINGKRHAFDTNTAKAISSRTFGEFGDPAGYEETLYRTRSGKYFVYGVGGCESPYSEAGDIKAVDEADASCWE